MPRKKQGKLSLARSSPLLREFPNDDPSIPPPPSTKIAVPVDVLPADVLALIFGYFHRRARLHCLSYVCKRWRVAALRSIDSFACTTERTLPWERRLSSLDVHRLAALYPRLTELSLLITRKIEKCILPATLRRLSLERLEHHVHEPFVAPFPPLTHLEFLSKNGLPEQLVRGCATSLASLRLVNESGVTFPFYCDLPALTSLTVEMNEKHVTRAVTATMIAQSASRLRHLAIKGLEIVQGYLATPFPVLESLSFTSCSLSLNSFAKFVAPQLKELRVLKCDAWDTAYRFLPPELCKLVVELNGLRPPERDLMPTLRLFWAANDCDLQNAQHCMPLIGSLTVDRYFDWSLLSLCTNLRCLRLNTSDCLRLVRSLTTLPRLIDLKFQRPPLTTVLLFDTLHAFLQRCPSLRTIRGLELEADITAGHVLQLLTDFALEAERHGVQRIDILSAVHRSAIARIAAHFHARGWLSINVR